MVNKSTHYELLLKVLETYMNWSYIKIKINKINKSNLSKFPKSQNFTN